VCPAFRTDPLVAVGEMVRTIATRRGTAPNRVAIRPHNAFLVSTEGWHVETVGRLAEFRFATKPAAPSLAGFKMVAENHDVVRTARRPNDILHAILLEEFHDGFQSLDGLFLMFCAKASFVVKELDLVHGLG
jgi:hypothetical protein